MGCFSYLCQVCGNPIKSDSFRGQKCVLFFLIDGKVIEKMEGEYDSYGRVFDENGKSINWNLDWSKIVDLHYNHKNDDGIAAFHKNCRTSFNEILDPMIISDDDPEQGWGSFYKQKTPFKGGKKVPINILSVLESMEAKSDLERVIDEMEQKFTSSNEIPVERTTITRKEWDVIRPILQGEVK